MIAFFFSYVFPLSFTAVCREALRSGSFIFVMLKETKQKRYEVQQSSHSRADRGRETRVVDNCKVVFPLEVLGCCLEVGYN